MAENSLRAYILNVHSHIDAITEREQGSTPAGRSWCVLFIMPVTVTKNQDIDVLFRSGPEVSSPNEHHRFAPYLVPNGG